MQDSEFNPHIKTTNNVKFYWRPKPVGETDEYGFRKDVLKEYIIIMSPGQEKSKVDRPVKDSDKQEYAELYRAFKDGAEQVQGGTPIDHAPFIQSEALTNKLKQLGFYTIEQLAGCSDLALQNIGMGAIKLRESAINHVRGNDPRDDEIAELKAQVAELMANMPKKRGPKPKANNGTTRPDTECS